MRSSLKELNSKLDRFVDLAERPLLSEKGLRIAEHVMVIFLEDEKPIGTLRVSYSSVAPLISRSNSLEVRWGFMSEHKACSGLLLAPLAFASNKLHSA